MFSTNFASNIAHRLQDSLGIAVCCTCIFHCALGVLGLLDSQGNSCVFSTSICSSCQPLPEQDAPWTWKCCVHVCSLNSPNSKFIS